MPDDLVVTPAEALERAQRLLDDGRPFHAHEVLEAAWKAAPEAERELWRGLAQLAVGLTHARRGNAAGAARLLDRAALRIGAYRDDPPHGVDVAGLVAFVAAGGDGVPRLKEAERRGRRRRAAAQKRLSAAGGDGLPRQKRVAPRLKGGWTG
ncbi:DUF309 domain-containing protein [Dactylosporangium darangshiense]|uniref:DUF309 domain-containing protein n=1 Tax=Dactylosporangium darangshiense TaxID=579108 RepID=UPI003634F8AD